MMNTLFIATGLIVSAYSQTIVELAGGDSRLTTLVQALTDADGDLLTVLSGAGPFTVFAPTNDAFAAITVPTDTAVLSNVLQYHVVSGSVQSSALSSGMTPDTIISQPISIQVGTGVSIYDTMGRMATVVEADIIASNGVIHIVDTVLLPDGTVADVTENIASLSTLNGALEANSLNTDTLDTVLAGTGPFTLFAPTNDAITNFAAANLINSDQLLYHVISGTEYENGVNIPTGDTALSTVQGAQVTVSKDANGVNVTDAVGRTAMVTIANIATTNGIVHVIDIVLEYRDIVGLAAADTRLTDLVTALTDNNLVTTLQGAGPFTVFAPTDAAVTAFGGSITAAVLTYHVLGAEYLSGAIPDGDTVLETVTTGEDVTITKDTNGVTVTDAAGRVATVTRADIQGSNGVIHIIDIVLEYRDVVGIASDDSTLSSLVTQLGNASLVTTLQGAGPFTVFAPTDTAFAALSSVPTGSALSNVLTYHVLASKVVSGDLSSGLVADTIQGESITVQIDDSSNVFIYDSMGNAAQVTVANIEGANGVIHKIDAVLMPGGTVVDIVVNTESLSSLETALTNEGLVSTLQGAGPFTVFAPTDDAITNFPAAADIDAQQLLYHVVSDDLLSTDIADGETVVATANTAGDEITVIKDDTGVYIKDATGRIAQVTMANLAATNGVVHIIDIVLAETTFGTIVDLAVEDSRLSSLVTELGNANLVTTLQGDGPFTVFAPTNDAFAALSAVPTGSALSSVLTYHVLSGSTVLSGSLSSGQVVDMLQGESVTVQIMDDGVFIYDSEGNAAQVTQADIQGTNGVIHIINAVLIPTGTVADIVSNIDSLSDLAGALTSNNLVTTLQGAGPFTVFAPTNDAITAFGGSIDDQLLLYHVLGAEYLSTAVPTTATELATANAAGDKLTVLRNDTGVFVTDALGRVAQVTIANIAGTNGVVHIIDIVLASTEFRDIVALAIADPRLTTVVSALTTANLTTTLSGTGPFTVFAPTDDAFTALVAAGVEIPTDPAELGNILQYHVLGSQVLSSALSSGLVATTLISQTITCQIIESAVLFFDSNGRSSQVIEADIQGTNGVIHVVDAVFLPDGTIADITSNVDSLSSLNGALVANDLDDTLSGTGPFTVFAPTNDAVTAFVAAGGEITSEVLLYHVVSGETFSGAVPTTATELTSANTAGDKLTVLRNDTGVFVTDATGRVATVSLANIAGTNGVAHVIDIVLAPEEFVTISTTDSEESEESADQSGVNRMSISTLFCITFYFLSFLIFV